MLNSLKSYKTKSAKRVGRGISAGGGKTAGRGTKGQKSRSGYNIPQRFEGGQTALLQRLPKMHGTKSRVIKPIAISYRTLEMIFDEGKTINKESLLENKLISSMNNKVKIIGSTKISKHFKFGENILFSKKFEQTIK